MPGQTGHRLPAVRGMLSLAPADLIAFLRFMHLLTTVVGSLRVHGFLLFLGSLKKSGFLACFGSLT
jgi:hypothetical protein